MPAAVRIGEAQEEQRTHVRDDAIAGALGDEAPRISRNASSLAALSAKWSRRPRLNIGWKVGGSRPGISNGWSAVCRPNFDEGITQAFLLEIDCNSSFENAFVEANQPIHIGSDERQVMDVSLSSCILASASCQITLRPLHRGQPLS
jgi:hypothetical protein